MNKTLKHVLAIIVIVAVVYFGNKGVQSYLGKEAMNKFGFTVYSLEEATQIANKEDKLVLADYSAIWCPSCRKLSQHVFASEEIAEVINDKFVYARLDYDTQEGAAFAAKHDLVGFPRVLILDKTGNRLTEMPLTFEPSEYKINLNKVINSMR